MLAPSVVSVLATVSLVAATGLGKATLMTGLPSTDGLASPAGSYSDGAPVPATCHSEATKNGCDATKVVARKVTVADCAQSWTICSCPGSGAMDLDSLMHKFIKIPPGIRSYVSGILAVPASGPSAYTYPSTGFSTYFGDCSQSVFIHESAHSVDQHDSAGKPWLSAIAASSCVPDPYSDTNAVEDFAQNMCLYTHDHYLGKAGNFNYACLQPQQNYIKNDSRLSTLVAAKTCNPSKRPPAPMTASSKFSAAVEEEHTDRHFY